MSSLQRAYTGTECREIDRYAIEALGIPSYRLMTRAAQFATTELLNRWPKPETVTIVCGSGNNAGDGYLVASLLHARRVKVQLIQVGDETRLSGDAKRAFDQIKEQGIEPSDQVQLAGDVIVDALLGTGSRGDVRPAYVEAIEKVNGANRPVVSLDLPSGIDADTGTLLNQKPVRASLTTCFVGAKVGLLTGRARNFVGELVVSDLGIPAEAFKPQGISIIPSNSAERSFPPRLKSGHKGQHGHVLVVAGNAGMGGAALLTAEACLRSGAGLVSVSTHPDHATGLLIRSPELMVRGSTSGALDPGQVNAADVIAVGPGLGQDGWANQALDAALASGKPLVIDADALNRLSDRAKKPLNNAILTPHPGEAGRLLSQSSGAIENDRIAAVTAISESWKSVVVLKGSGTLVADSGRLHGLCDIAEPALSTAGSGDVLTGIIAAAYAQVKNPVTAASLGVYHHATAGQRSAANEPGQSVIASDIIDAIRPWGT